MQLKKSFLALASLLTVPTLAASVARAKAGIPTRSTDAETKSDVPIFSLLLRNADGWYVGVVDLPGDAAVFPRSIALTPNKTEAAPIWIDLLGQLHVYYAKQPNLTSPIVMPSSWAQGPVTVLVYESDAGDSYVPVTGFYVAPNGTLLLNNPTFAGITAPAIKYTGDYRLMYWYTHTGENSVPPFDAYIEQTLFVEPAITW